MKITPLNIDGAFEIDFNPIEDERGFFMRTYDENFFTINGIHRQWVQENHSCSLKKGILRGMHFQFPPHDETKVVRVVNGKIFDVLVDLRKNSPTFGRWESLELSAENKKMLYIPKGCAHGFCTLSDSCDVLYKVDNFYHPEAEGSILWNDPDVGIHWPFRNPMLSEKDKNAMTLTEFKEKFKGIEIQSHTRLEEKI